LSKHLRRLPDPSVLHWFQRGWDEARHDADAWVQRELGADVYGLDSIFDRAVEHQLPKPATWAELERLLAEYLYVEGELRVCDGAIRVLTDDDEVHLAYYFLDDEVLRSRPHRLAYFVDGQWPLPANAADSGAGPRITVVVSSFDGTVEPDVQHHVLHVDGLRLPGLAPYLRRSDVQDHWPAELVVLRAVLREDDDLERAIRTMNRWKAFDGQAFDTAELTHDHDSAHRSALDALGDGGMGPGPMDDREPAASRVVVADHLAQASLHMSETFGHRQLIMFDDLWSAAHPDLCSSLMDYATHWDPLRD
jgi:hypothetical protein